VEITFYRKKLKQQANDYQKGIRDLGQKRAKLLQKRLQTLRFAESLEDVRYAPGHFHELTNNRKGQWACDLDQPYRLIFIPHEQPVPTDENGISIWVEIKGVEIREIVDYH